VRASFVLKAKLAFHTNARAHVPGLGCFAGNARGRRGASREPMSACELAHRIQGEPGDPPLVLANSLGTDMSMWNPQAPALAQRFRLLRYDARGQGASPSPPGPYEIADLGRDVLALLDRLELERVSFCGVSIGGMPGIWLAAHAPDRIDRLVVCCSSAYMPPPSRWHERAAAVRAAGTVEVVADAVVEN